MLYGQSFTLFDPQTVDKPFVLLLIEDPHWPMRLGLPDATKLDATGGWCGRKYQNIDCFAMHFLDAVECISYNHAKQTQILTRPQHIVARLSTGNFPDG
jgi:hypothetical protein